MASDSTIATNIELRNRGIVLVQGGIDDNLVGSVAQQILYLNEAKLDRVTCIRLVLNSCGGDLSSAFMLADLIAYSALPVHITGLGVCASAGILLLCSGSKGNRVITKNTALLSHQYTWGYRQKYHDLVADRKEQDRQHLRMVDHFRRHTRLTTEQVKRYLLPPSDVWLSHDEALKFGLVDKVIGVK